MQERLCAGTTTHPHCFEFLFFVSLDHHRHAWRFASKTPEVEIRHIGTQTSELKSGELHKVLRLAWRCGSGPSLLFFGSAAVSLEGKTEVEVPK